MTPSERPAQGGLGRLVAAAVAFALVAPASLVALPLALLLLFTPLGRRGAVVFTGIAAGYSAWWLLGAGELPDQLLRAALVLSATTFVILTLRTRLTFTHRALAALAAAMAGCSVLLRMLGSSWAELSWWVSNRAGLAARDLTGALWSRIPLDQASASGSSTMAQFEASLGTMVQIAAEFFPAITALQLVAGLALATAIYQRVAARPHGVPLGRFRDLRFSEHLGWALAIPLVVVLLPKLAAFKAAAANMLVVAGVLYALRGAAVVAYGVLALGGSGFFLWAFWVVIFILLLPIVLGGAILLGVLDGGLDLRRRWSRATSE
jgi:hypothetical protein